MWKKPTRLRLLTIVLLVVLYIAVLLRATTESSRRSLQLRDETLAQDRIVVSVLVTNVNPVTQELTAQLGFRLAGDIALDEVTPAADLELLVNNVSGQQAYDFPKGKRMNRIEVVFPLNGDLNKYPFDRYETTMWLLAASNNAQVPKALGNQPQDAHHAQKLAIGAVTLQRNAPLALSLALSASIPVSSSGAASRATRAHKS